MPRLPHQMPLLNRLYQRFLALPLARKTATLATVFSVGAMLILILASHQGQRQFIDQSGELFGESLVQQLSRDASSPLVQGDKLSLQSLLNELVESPLIAHGAVYDVENRPVAEAGETIDGQSISASITFQDSLAGYAVVTFDTAPLARRATGQSWQLVLLAGLLGALVFVLALYPGRQLGAIVEDLIRVAETPLKRRRANTQVAYRGEDELGALSRVLLQGPAEPENQAPSPEFAVLTVEITNLPSLQVNLGHRALAEALQTLRDKLATICRLYDGELEASRSHCFTARFTASDDAGSYPFRALCAAFLIEHTLADEDLPFHVRQAVVTNDTTLARLEPVTGRQMAIEHSLLLSAMVAEGIVISESVHRHGSVSGRVLTTSLGDGAIRAERLGENYQQLLERQINLLRAR